MAGTGINGPFNFTTREYFDNAGDPNAAKGSTLSFEELDETLLFLSASAASASSAAILEQNVTPTEVVGGYNPSTPLVAGLTFTEFVVGLLTPYQPPSISSLTLRDGGTTVGGIRELGNDFNVTNIVFNASDDSNSAYPHSASITWTGNTDGGGDENNLSLTDSVLNPSNNLPLPGIYNPYYFNRFTSGSILFTVTSKYPNNITPINTSTTFTYRMLSIFGGFPSATIGDQQTFYNTISSSAGTAAWNVGGNTTTGGNPSRGNYPYYLFNSSFDIPDAFRISVGTSPLANGWVNMGTINVDNQFGVPIELRVIRAINPESYSNGQTLEFLYT
jgi:hypothetical protein